MQQPVKRLIDFFKPETYKLAIDQNSETLTFSGSVQISGQFLKLPLTLHSSDLDIKSTKVNGQTYEFSCDEKAQELTISAPKSSLGEIVVEVEFSGIITRPMHGLHPCFFEHDGKQKRLLATQFESHHAREVFPCVDEPEAKAVFILALTTDANDVTISNMPVAKEATTSDRKTTTFEPTPVMSTYLLAWVSGELIYEEAISKHGVHVRTYATPVHAGKLAYSVEVACKSMDFMDDYFDIAYPLKKFDQIALPDFAAAAMENWGCVTFRESALLYDPNMSDLSDKQHIADVVIHEMSHQWFGNLVTMRWWEDLWLNEGFASWIPYLVRDELYPEWKMWEQFATGDLMIGLRADSLENTHPIVVKINSPEEIRSAFDSISYDKGCSVINLLYNYIGKTAFRDGLRIYLKRHAYSNAETSDLWRAWSESSGKNVAQFMSTWTEKPGFPIVSVTSNQTSSTLSQQRFFTNLNHADDGTVWPIPLLRSPDDTDVFTSSTMEVNGLQKLNAGQPGFYRAIYSGPIKAQFEKSIADQSMNPVDVLGLVNDAAESAKAGYHSITEALDLAVRTKNYQNEALITTALGEFAETRNILSDTFEAFMPIVKDFIQPNLQRLGIEQVDGESVDDELLRPALLSSASYAGDNLIIDWALDQFKCANSPEDIRPDVRSVVYQTAVRELGDEATYDKLLNWYKTNTIPGERSSLAVALVSFKDRELFNRSLDLITTDEVKLQDSLIWVAYSLNNRHNKQIAWTWVKNNWDWVAKNFGKEKEIDYYLRFCARGFATDEHLADYTAFFDSVEIFGSKRAFEQGKETIAWQSAWRKRDTEKVLQWLKNFTLA
jgi:aminopeptidase N